MRMGNDRNPRGQITLLYTLCRDMSPDKGPRDPPNLGLQTNRRWIFVVLVSIYEFALF